VTAANIDSSGHVVAGTFIQGQNAIYTGLSGSTTLNVTASGGDKAATFTGGNVAITGGNLGVGTTTPGTLVDVTAAIQSPGSAWSTPIPQQVRPTSGQQHGHRYHDCTHLWIDRHHEQPDSNVVATNLSAAGVFGLSTANASVPAGLFQNTFAANGQAIQVVDNTGTTKLTVLGNGNLASQGSVTAVGFVTAGVSVVAVTGNVNALNGNVLAKKNVVVDNGGANSGNIGQQRVTLR